jgi:hypothetical protein
VVGWFGGGLLHKVDGCELKVTYSARSDALELSGELPKQREAYTLSAAPLLYLVQCARPCIYLYAHSFSLLVPALLCYRLPPEVDGQCVCQYISPGCFNMTLLPMSD